VLAAGGDGTLGEVANGLAGTAAVLAPIPVGTANSFAKELQMPLPRSFSQGKLLQAANSLASGKVHKMDLGYSYDPDGGGRYWLLWAGTGADGFLVDQLEPRPKWSKKLGRFGYIAQSLIVAPRLPRMKARVTVDGQVVEGVFLLVVICNCRRYAGGEILLSPHARLDDGVLEIWFFHGAGMMKAIYYFLQAKRGRHLESPNITAMKGRRITVHTDPVMPCQTDGDRAGDSPLQSEVRPGALRLLVPDTAPKDLFERPGENLQ
jgi:YegS/Rv2252/BmrU family lipid kinase